MDTATSSTDTLKSRKKKDKKKKDKKSSNPHCLKKDDGSLQAGTIDAIVEYLLDNVDVAPEEVRLEENELQVRTLDHERDNDLQVFIISYRQFVSPTRFFLILEERFNANEDRNSRLAVLRMLSVWLDKYLDRDFFFHDKGNRLFDQLLKFIGNLSQLGYSQQANELKLLILRVKNRKKVGAVSIPDSSKNSTMMMLMMQQQAAVSGDESDDRPPLSPHRQQQALQQGLDMRELTRSSSKTDIGSGSVPSSPSSGSGNSAGGSASSSSTPADANSNGPIGSSTLGKKFSLCEMPLADLAVQLTLIERNMFRAIREREFLNLNWKKEDQKRNSRHIVKMVERFNKVSYWVATRIVREVDLKRRTSLLKRFIILAEKCSELNNYNTLMEVLAGLNLHPVQRLKATWRGLSEKYMELMKNLEHLMENKQNYKNYREKLAKLKQSGDSTLPYLGVYLRDLTFIEEGNATTLEDGLINYEKIQLVGQVIREVQFFQTCAVYPDLVQTTAPTTIKYLKKLRGMRQEQLDEKSRECEPAGSPVVRDRKSVV